MAAPLGSKACYEQHEIQVASRSWNNGAHQFNVFIHDLNDRTELTLSKFMDDIKLERTVKLES